MSSLCWAPALAAVLFHGLESRQTPEIVIKSEMPAYQVRLPSTYVNSEPKEIPRRYLHQCGRDPWEKVHAVLSHGAGPLEQNPAGITQEDILPFVTLPPDS